MLVSARPSHSVCHSACNGVEPVDQHSPQRLGSPSHLHTSYPHARSTCTSSPETGGTDEPNRRRVLRYQLCSPTTKVGLYAVACDRAARNRAANKMGASNRAALDRAAHDRAAHDRAASATVTIDTAVRLCVDRTGSSGPGHVARGGNA